MSCLRRTGSGDLAPLHLDMDIQYTYQMQWHHLIPPGTSSPRTALICASLADSVSDAEDVVAIAFMELWRRRNEVRVINGSVIAWLLVTTTHCTRNIKRSSLRYRALLNRLPRSEHSQDAAEQYLHGSIDGLDARLALELRSLGWADQQLLSLVALEGFSMAEAADVLGISLSAVKSRLHRLRQRLQPRLSLHMNEATS